MVGMKALDEVTRDRTQLPLDSLTEIWEEESGDGYQTLQLHELFHFEIDQGAKAKSHIRMSTRIIA